MNKNEILNTILAIPGAQMARVNKTNFVIIPGEDGVTKVSIGTALSIDTKNRKAFNAEAAVAEYKAWEAEAALREAEKAAKPVKAKGPSPEAQARRDELDTVVKAMPAFQNFTATDIMNAMGDLSFKPTRMAVGQCAKRLVENGVLTVEKKEKKAYYSKG